MWHRMLGTILKAPRETNEVRSAKHKTVSESLLKVWCSNDSLFSGTVILILQYFILDLRKSAKP
jgi:hypothetical protein